MKKRFISMIMALAMVMSPYVQASAAEVSADSSTEVSVDAGIEPQDVNYLRELRGMQIYNGHPETIEVTPASGTNLKFVGHVDGTQSGVKMEVTKNGGWWPSKTVTVYAGANQGVYDLINNCNGEKYTIKMTFTGSFSPVAVWGYFTQSDYA